ncbi:galactose/lactose metabolism regulatory protein Gal80p [Monosporozyma unispora]|nr:transcription regulator gal80 [Kazachstania unispora]
MTYEQQSELSTNMNNMSTTIKIGMIGFSLQNTWAIKTHYPAIQQLSSNFQITALFNESLDESLQTIRQLKLENATAFPSLESFILSSNIDMILVAIHDKNYDPLIAELVANVQQLKFIPNHNQIKYIFLDWPLNCSIEQVEYLVQETAKLDIQTVTSLQGRKSPYVMRAKDLIAEGSIGEINSIEIAGNGAWYGYERPIKSPSYLYDMSNGKDLVSNAFAHTIDVVQYITQSHFKQLNSMIFNNIPKQELIDDNGNRTGEFVEKKAPDHLLFQGKLIKGNVPVSCSFKGGKPTKKFTKNLVIDIHGTRGDIKLEGDAGFIEMSNLVLYYSGMKVEDITTAENVEVKTPGAYDAGKEVMEFYHLRNYNALLGNIFRLYQSIIDVHLHQLKLQSQQKFAYQGFQKEGYPTLTDGLVLYRLIQSVFKSNLLGSTLDVSNLQ